LSREINFRKINYIDGQFLSINKRGLRSHDVCIIDILYILQHIYTAYL